MMHLRENHQQATKINDLEKLHCEDSHTIYRLRRKLQAAGIDIPETRPNNLLGF